MNGKEGKALSYGKMPTLKCRSSVGIRKKPPFQYYHSIT